MQTQRGKRLLPFSVLLVLSFLSCDVDEHPITDPNEIYERALSELKEGNYHRAKQLLEQACEKFRNQDNSERLGEALVQLSQTEYEIGEFHTSLASSREAAMLARKEGNTLAEAQMSLLEASIYVDAHEYSEAVAAYRSAFSLANAFDNKPALIEAKIRLAYVALLGGDLDEALDGYKNALDQAQTSGDQNQAASVLKGLGTIYRLRHQFIEALNSLTQAVATVNTRQDPMLAASIQSEMGLVHIAQNSMNAALADFRDAINILRREKTGKEYEPVLLFQIGRLYEKNNKLLDAKKYYTEAMEIAHSVGDRIAENYLYIFIIRCTYQLMTSEQQLGNIDRLRQSYDQIAKRFQECAHASGEGYLYVLIGKLFEQAGDAAKARDYYLKSVLIDQNSFGEYYSEQLHAPYWEALGIEARHIQWYQNLISILLKLNRKEEALKITELYRMKEFNVDFQSAEISLRHPKLKQQSADIRSRLKEAKLSEIELSAKLYSSRNTPDLNQITTERRRLEAMKQELRSESKQVITQYPNYETILLPSPIELTSYQKYIPSGSLAVRYFMDDHQLSIFCLSKSTFDVRKVQIGRDSLLHLMSEYKRLMQDPSVYSGEGGVASMPAMTRYAMLSTKIYDLMLRPIESLFDKGLIIISDHEVEGFPFHALERQDRRGVMYISEIITVDYLPSLGSLRYITTSYSKLNSIVAFGNPTGKNWSVDYELRDIRSFFKGTKIMVGLEASWNNMKSVKPDVLQIFTDYNDAHVGEPLGTFMLSDGLTVEQSISLPFEKLSEMNAVPIMLLSNHSDQHVGLNAEQAMFLRINGVSDVFLNSWIADRKAAKYFSEYFFTHLVGGLAPGDAYRQALLNLIHIREVNHQRSWGQFFHFGVG